MRPLVIIVLILAALFCSYSCFHFLTIADISSPEQLPRVEYNRNAWGLFTLLAIGALAGVIRYWPAKRRPR